MALIKTRFDGYFIDDQTFEVYSDKKGKLRKLKRSFVRDTRKTNPKPYIQVGVPGCSLLHRIIADTFIAPVEGLTVNHLDGNTLNNSVSNLEVVIQQQNQAHAVAAGLVPRGEAHGRAVYTDELLLAALREIKTGASVKSSAKKYGITQSYLNRVKNGKYRSFLQSLI